MEQKVTISNKLGLHARASAKRRWLDHPLLKFGVFALVPALPAFRLNQVITFGGSFGEALAYGWPAWLTALALWWASWVVMMVLWAGALRVIVEAASLLAMLVSPTRAIALRGTLEAMARWGYYLGVPAWLVWRLLLT